MIWYVLIAFTAILLGMFTSVKAFGTGGKRKKIFQDIYFSVEDVDGIAFAKGLGKCCEQIGKLIIVVNVGRVFLNRVLYLQNG